MPFELTQQGTTIVITDTDTGRYPDFEAVRSDIIKKEAVIVIDTIIIQSNGANYTIENGFEKIQTGLPYDDILTPDVINNYEKQHQEQIKLEKNALEEKNKKEKQALENAMKSGEWDGVSDEVKDAASANIILTTSMFVSCRDIDYELDVITYECAYGMNIFRDLFASVRDIVGGRSKAVETVLRDARKVVMHGLREEALNLGADAVIAIDIDYSELSGGGKSGMLVAIATGTAVKLK